jgi:hypothetical protein
MQLVFDVEANGLLAEATKVWCLVTQDVATGKQTKYTFDNTPTTTSKQAARQRRENRNLLCIAIDGLYDTTTEIIGHNIIDYDLPLLEKLLDWKPNERITITDTLILSRLGNPDRLRPTRMSEDGVKAGPHSLAAWGYRVGVGKPGHEDWSVFSEAMLHRCSEDVRINTLIYPILLNECAGFGESIPIEHEVQRIISQQERTGVYFDRDRAVEYIEQLRSKVCTIDERLVRRLPRYARRVGVSVTKPFKKDGTLSKMVTDFSDQVFSDEVNTTGAPDHQGCFFTGNWASMVSAPFTRIEYYQTDLNSDKQVKEWLLSIGWKPKEWNISKLTGDKTSPKLTPDSFVSLPENLGVLLKERVTWRHRASQIQGWVDKYRADGTLGAGANPMGTNTGRMRHRCVVNIPKASSFGKNDPLHGQLWWADQRTDSGMAQPVPFGTEMRSLFCHRPGRRFVGHDASGLELRMLAHYLDDKDYTEQILNGDIHSYNQRLAGLPTRDSAKTFIYAFIYGAGDAKLGSIINGSKADGTRLRNQFLSALPKLGQLIDKVKKASLRGYLIGLDGRKIFMRKDSNGDVMQHKALNTLLQCAGAVIMKKSIVILDHSATDLDAMKVIDMHDEGQADVSVKDAELYAVLAVQSIVQAGTHFNLNIPLDGEAKIGANWAETH